MERQSAEKLLNELANGTIKEFEIKKNDFLAFRSFLVAREDFKHFRGEATHGGNVKYTYLTVARS